MSSAAAARGGAQAVKASGRAVLIAKQTEEALAADRPRIKQLYRAGLPRAAHNLINAFSNRPVTSNQRPPTESILSANLDDRIASANSSIDAALGRPLQIPKNETAWVVLTRGQHVPVGIMARDLKNRFWHRFYKGSRDAAQAANERKKNKDVEEEAK